MECRPSYDDDGIPWCTMDACPADVRGWCKLNEWGAAGGICGPAVKDLAKQRDAARAVTVKVITFAGVSTKEGTATIEWKDQNIGAIGVGDEFSLVPLPKEES